MLLVVLARGFAGDYSPHRLLRGSIFREGGLLPDSLSRRAKVRMKTLSMQRLYERRFSFLELRATHDRKSPAPKERAF